MIAPTWLMLLGLLTSVTRVSLGSSHNSCLNYSVTWGWYLIVKVKEPRPRESEAREHASRPTLNCLPVSSHSWHTWEVTSTPAHVS